MRVFVIEAYGGRHATDGSVVNFTVAADTAAEAIRTIQAADPVRAFDHFDIVAEEGEVEADEPAILVENQGPQAPGR